jgi:hypothetical protein
MISAGKDMVGDGMGLCILHNICQIWTKYKLWVTIVLGYPSATEEWKYVLLGVQLFSKGVLCDDAYLTAVDIHMLLL